MTVLLYVEALNKTYAKNVKALVDIDLEVQQGEFVALLGPSGCGKTTLLTTLAGFLAPDSGRISMDGKDITRVPPHKRALNTVFQNYALFPHMSVLENVAFGPRRVGASKSEARRRAMEALDMVSLADAAERYPAAMSGGQRQRVALARAIVNRPRLLLLDEPLSALDMKLRRRMQLELKALQEKLGISFICVTHDQEEAMAMADRIVVMNEGRIEQVGSGDAIYQRPANRFVAEFIGDANLLPCEAAGDQLQLTCCGARLGTAAGECRRLLAVVRPEDIKLDRAGDGAQGVPTGSYAADVIDVVNIGSYTTFHMLLNGAIIEARRIGGNDLRLCKGDKVALTFRSGRVHFVEP